MIAENLCQYEKIIDNIECTLLKSLYLVVLVAKIYVQVAVILLQ